MCYEKAAFKEMKPLPIHRRIILRNGESIFATHIGSVELNLKTGNTYSLACLQNVLYTPAVTKNLFSVASCIEAGNKVTFTSANEVVIRNRAQEVVGQGKFDGGLWSLECPSRHGKALHASAITNLELWHNRYGHLGEQNLRKVQQLVTGMEDVEMSKLNCHNCAEGKQTTHPTVSLPKLTSRPLELVHSDVCGPISPTSLGGNRYFVSFIDDYTRKAWIYCIKDKAEVFQKFKHFKHLAENQSGEKIKAFRSDHGGEYESKVFDTFLADNGIERSQSAPYAPNQNGVAERLNRTLKEMVIAMLSSSELPKCLWGEAILTANYLKNRSPHNSVEGKTPEEAWTKKKPSVRHLRTFGCKTSVLFTSEKKQKFDSRVWWGALVGYGGSSLGYRSWNPAKQQIVVRKDVKFFEGDYLKPAPSLIQNPRSELYELDFSLPQDPSPQNGKQVSIQSNSQGTSSLPPPPFVEPEEEEEPIRRSTRIKKPVQRMTSEKLGELFAAAMERGEGLLEPQTYKEAMESRDVSFGRKPSLMSLDRSKKIKLGHLWSDRKAGMSSDPNSSSVSS